MFQTPPLGSTHLHFKLASLHATEFIAPIGFLADFAPLTGEITFGIATHGSSDFRPLCEPAFHKGERPIQRKPAPPPLLKKKPAPPVQIVRKPPPPPNR